MLLLDSEPRTNRARRHYNAASQALAADPGQMARFEREARLFASLNHRKVAVIHGIEERERIRFLSWTSSRGDSRSGPADRGCPRGGTWKRGPRGRVEHRLCSADPIGWRPPDRWAAGEGVRAKCPGAGPGIRAAARKLPKPVEYSLTKIGIRGILGCPTIASDSASSRFCPEANVPGPTHVQRGIR